MTHQQRTGHQPSNAVGAVFSAVDRKAAPQHYSRDRDPTPEDQRASLLRAMQARRAQLQRIRAKFEHMSSAELREYGRLHYVQSFSPAVKKPAMVDWLSSQEAKSEAELKTALKERPLEETIPSGSCSAPASEAVTHGCHSPAEELCACVRCGVAFRSSYLLSEHLLWHCASTPTPKEPEPLPGALPPGAQCPLLAVPVDPRVFGETSEPRRTAAEPSRPKAAPGPPPSSPPSPPPSLKNSSPKRPVDLDTILMPPPAPLPPATHRRVSR
eukprot:RCo010259